MRHHSARNVIISGFPSTISDEGGEQPDGVEIHSWVSLPLPKHSLLEEA